MTPTQPTPAQIAEKIAAIVEADLAGTYLGEAVKAQIADLLRSQPQPSGDERADYAHLIDLHRVLEDLESLSKSLQVPAAEYVPVIPEAWERISQIQALLLALDPSSLPAWQAARSSTAAAPGDWAAKWRSDVGILLATLDEFAEAVGDGETPDDDGGLVAAIRAEHAAAPTPAAGEGVGVDAARWRAARIIGIRDRLCPSPPAGAGGGR